MTSTQSALRAVRIWDLPTRLFHWLLVVLFAFSYISGEIGDDMLRWHFLSGYAIMTLVLYRIVWGFVGSRTARFSDFIKGPGVTLHHLRDMFSTARSRDVGHNPLGGLMIVALLLLLLVQVITGLFAQDRNLNFGPLALLVSDKTSHFLKEIHETTVNILLVLIGLHVAAVLFYLVFKRENLVVAMFSGEKQLDLPPGMEPKQSSPYLALLVLIVCAAIVYGIVRLGG